MLQNSAASPPHTSSTTVEDPEKEPGIIQSNCPNTNDNGENRPPDINKNGGEEGSVEPAEQDFLVWWEEPIDQDPSNPMNWPKSKKWGTIAVLSSITFLTLVFSP